ncbi:MAG: SagB/ThcOx family dehydrogenase [Tannerellaceae bacterium]|jgi:SagB-type dehydrogenase family enzyme|nr:SagB/ThcOx family dehydrogenase [Tannerellaceae bacterium]
MMKNSLFLLSITLFVGAASAQDLKVIKLDPPRKTGGAPLMKAFNDRKSDRVFSTLKLKAQDLSDILWAANGINRPDGKRTAPTAINAQDVDVYAVMEDGAYLYDAKAHALTPVAKGDYRGAVATTGQEFVKDAPLSLVIVSDISRFGRNTDENTRLMGAVDIGIVCQNINLVCAGLGISTVPRASMDKDALKKALKLKDSQLLLMNNPVGYPKK